MFRLQSLEKLATEDSSKIFEGMRYNVDPDDRLIAKLRECKEELNLYITVPGIACITLSGEAKIFGLLSSLL